jgi:multiple sugar transport system permease protein
MLHRVKRRLAGAAITAAILLVLAVCLFPIIMMLMTALKTPNDAIAVPPVWFFKPIFTNFRDIFTMYPLWLYLSNSLICATASTVISLAIGAPAAYSLARFKFRARENVATWILSTRMAPPIAAVIPYFILLRTFRLLDTRGGLIIIYVASSLPFVVWMMRGFFEDIPQEIEESARVDGCSRYGAMVRVAFPLAAPGLTAAAILVFIFNWNEFLFALLTTGRRAQTMPVAVSLFMKEFGIQWGYMAATAITMIVPLFVFTLFIQKYLVRGLTMGAIK